MKILYLFQQSLNNERAHSIQVVQMCHAFQKIGINVTLAVPTTNNGVDNLEIIRNRMGIDAQFSIKEYPKFSVKGRLSSLGCYFGVKSLLDRNTDFDYYYTRSPFLLRLAINRGLRKLYESHDSRLHPQRLFNKLYLKRFIKDVNSKHLIKFVVISQALANIWKVHMITSDKVMVLHDGISREDFLVDIGRDEARKNLAIDEARKLVVYSGSLYRNRGIENILKLAGSFPDATFYIVGGPLKDKQFYESMAEQNSLSNIFFTGRVPHFRVRDYLFAADVHLLLLSWQAPTINICSPMKLFEYMAAGRNIVAQGFPTINEVLIDGETALLADPDSYKDLERKLCDALSLGYPNDMAQKARHIALSKYCWETRASTIVKALEEFNH